MGCDQMLPALQSPSTSVSISAPIQTRGLQYPVELTNTALTLPPFQEIARQTLRKYWGYDGFRPGQWDIVKALLEGEDVLGVLPTGSGKSLCFQLPALCRPGLTLVVSPLIALMEDQVASLQGRGIAAASLHSQLDSVLRRQTLRQLNRLKLLYLSPETLLSPKVWRQLQLPHLKIAALIIDEAHCLTQWGDSFRPAYDRLGCVRRALLATKPLGSQFPMAALTATADRVTRHRIAEALQLDQPVEIVQSPHRPNLDLQVKRIWTPRQRRRQTFAFLQRQASRSRVMPSGLIYVRNRRDSETLAQQCREQGFETMAYHGGLSASRRRQIEQAWLAGAAAQGGLGFVVCTSAFGMGIDLPSCRWVLHYHLPLLLAEYVQEVGRAGRDGKPAVALALASEPTGWLEPSDRQRNHHFLQALAQQQRRCLAIAQQFPQEGDWHSICQQFPKQGALSLALLHRMERLVWRDPFHFRLIAQGKSGKSLASCLGDSSQTMKQFLGDSLDPWRFINETFA